MDQQTGLYTIGQPQDAPEDPNVPQVEERCYLYCPYINHAGLANIEYKTFFHMCRVEGVSFDLEKRQGATFILSDTLQSGVISIIAIGNFLANHRPRQRRCAQDNDGRSQLHSEAGIIC